MLYNTWVVSEDTFPYRALSEACQLLVCDPWRHSWLVPAACKFSLSSLPDDVLSSPSPPFMYGKEVSGMKVDAILRGGIRKFTDEVRKVWRAG